MMRRPSLLLGAGLLILALAGCKTTPSPVEPPQAPAPGRGIGIYKVGKPYQVNGFWYYPNADIGYDETGLASWYGEESGSRYTANGEIFDPNLITAAHKTLPLPSIAQVTNLDNGRSIQVRINDRGPYAAGRIIDVSRRAAQLLGFDQVGTAKIRVRVLKAETIEAESLAKLNGSDAPIVAEAAPPATPHQAIVAQSLPPPGRPAPLPPAPSLPPAAPPAPPQPAPQPPAHPVPPGPPLAATVMVFPVHPTHMYVQAGAFASIANAERMQQRLAGLGTVAITGVRINGENLYRVRLGPLASVDEADGVLARTHAIGALDAKIVVD